MIGWKNLSQCGGTEEEIIFNAQTLVAKVPFENKVKEEMETAPDNSSPSIGAEQEQEPELTLILIIRDGEPENLECEMKEEETDEEELMHYRYSCIKCSKMFSVLSPCLEHMTNKCQVAPDDFPHEFWQKTWRTALKIGAKSKANEVKIKKRQNVSEEKLVEQIKKFYAANPYTRRGNVVQYLRKIHGRKHFHLYGYGKLTSFIERHGLK